MSSPPSIERRSLWRRPAAAALLVALGFVVLTLLDERLYHLLALGPASRAAIAEQDWYRLLRIIGFLPTWLALAAAVILIGRGRQPATAVWLRGGLIALAPALAGLAAEATKLLVGRERPEMPGDDAVFQGYRFKPFLSAFADGSNLGFPSSHAATAFGGAVMLGLLVPAVRPLALALAAGCALTRLLAGAHFATDVYAAIVLGAGVSLGLHRLAARRLDGAAAEPGPCA